MSTLDSHAHEQEDRSPELPRPTNAPLPADIFKQALHTASNLVVLTDPNIPDNPIVWVNDYFCEFTGYDREEVVGRNCRFLQGEDRQQLARQVLRDHVDTGEAANVVLRNYKKDGTLFYNDLHVSPVYDADGRLVYFLGVQNDATDLEQALATVRERDQQLHDLTETERERFGMELHEGLGQVLTGAALSAQAHLRELERVAPDLAASARTVSELIAHALVEARQIAAGLHPVLDKTNGLQTALLGLAASMDEAAEGMHITAEIDDVVVANRRTTRHLYRIAQEAVANALRHAEAQHITLRLYESSSADARTVVLEVEDDGQGIQTEVLMSDYTTPPGMRVSEVAGLAQHGRGLYSMRFRADQMSATLAVTPGEDGGTIVRCVAPLS
ncbi:MAG: PAS domain-containing protein [Bacteroidota bacterium]